MHIHAAYAIVCFPVLVPTFYVKVLHMYITGTLLVALACCITFNFVLSISRRLVQGEAKHLDVKAIFRKLLPVVHMSRYSLPESIIYT